MAQPLEHSEEKNPPKPDTIKVNIASNESKNIKINVRLKWTVLQLKEHLYNYNHFPSMPFNQIISLYGTDLQNTQTFEQIYDVITTNKGSANKLHSLRGNLTWDANDINISKIIKQNDDENEDDDDSKQSKLPNTQSIHEISLYIRAKRTPKRILSTLTSEDSIIKEFVNKHRESVVTIDTPRSDSTDSSSSSSESTRGYRARIFDPDAMRKKQERKALKRLRKKMSFSPKSSPVFVDAILDDADDEDSDSDTDGDDENNDECKDQHKEKQEKKEKISI